MCQSYLEHILQHIIRTVGKMDTVCVCVCVYAFVYVCVCVCMCVCVCVCVVDHTLLHIDNEVIVAIS